MALQASLVPKNTTEPLYQNPIIDESGQLQEWARNWFEGKGRQIGEIISGVDRNAQNIVQLETDYTAADSVISAAYIAADAVVAANASSARATLETNLTAAYQAADATIQTDLDAAEANITTLQSTTATNTSAIAANTSEITAARDGEASLTAKIGAVETAFAAGDAANATSITTLEAQTRTEYNRTNFVPAAYVLTGEDEALANDDLYSRSNCNISGTGLANPFTGRDAVKINCTGFTTRLGLFPYNGNSFYSNYDVRDTLYLEAGNYALRFNLRVASNITEVSVILRGTDGADNKVYTWTPDTTSYTTLTATFDTSGYSTTEFSIEIEVKTSSTTTSNAWHFGRIQICEYFGSETLADIPWLPLTPSEANTRASVEVLKQAFVDNDGVALAQFSVTAAAGGDPARISLTDGSGGSNIALDADEVFFGSDTVFEDTNDTFYTESGGERYRYGGPFGSSSDLLQWFGPDSVSLNSESKTNGNFAFATDGKVYLGADEMNNVPTLSLSDDSQSYSTGTGTKNDVITLTPGNFPGSGGYTYSSEVILDPNSTISVTSPTSSSPTVVTDTASATIAQVKFTAYRAGASASAIFSVNVA